MITVVLVIHLVIAMALVGVILIQRSEGGALSGLGGGTMGGLMSARGTANLLTRVTAVLAACFIGTSLLLAVLSGRGGPGSILDTAPPPASAPPAAEAPTAPTPPAGEAPAAPAEPPQPAEPAPPIAQ